METDEPNNRVPVHKHTNINGPKERTPDDDLRDLRAANDPGERDISSKVMLALALILLAIAAIVGAAVLAM